jgi:multiple sugar transport system substrate-binding protein
MTFSRKRVISDITSALIAICFSLCLIALTGCAAENPDADGVIHLTLWQGVNPPPNRDVLQELVDEFNQTHSDIQVEPLYVGQGDQQMPKILAAVVGNAPPDMLWYAPTITGQLIELGAIRPIEEWLAESPVQEQIDPALFESMQLEGHTWSVPFGTNNVGVFYRPSLFEAAGITELPTTWEEFRQVAKTLTRQVNGQTQHGILLPLGKGEWTVFNWLPFMWSGGGDIVAESAAGLNLVNPGAIAALQLWRDLIDDGSAILSQPERGYELDGFLAGRVAMQLTGPWTLGQLQATGVDFAVMPIPAQERAATSVGGENLFIFNTTSAHERAAFTFAEFVVSEPFQTQWAIGTGYLPVNLRSRQSLPYQEFIAQQPAVDVFLKQAEYGRSRPIFAGYSRVSENLGRAIEAILLGQSTPEAALETAQRRLNLLYNNSK